VNATNALCTALNIPAGTLQANGYPACVVSVDNSACTNTASSIQSPIDIPTDNTVKVVYNTTLRPLNIKYGTTTSWTMEVQSNYLEVRPCPAMHIAAGCAVASTHAIRCTPR
jgi:hypothetical protein